MKEVIEQEIEDILSKYPKEDREELLDCLSRVATSMKHKERTFNSMSKRLLKEERERGGELICQ